MAVGGPGAGVPAQIDGIYELVLWHSQQLQLGLVTRKYRVSLLTAPAPTLGQMATAFANSFATMLKALLNTTATFRGASVRKIWPVPVSPLAWDTVGAGAGTAVGDPMPKQTCGLITCYSALAGRAGRTRSYLPFPAEADNDTDSTPTAAYLTRLQTVAAQLLAQQVVNNAPGSATFTPVVWHRVSHTTNDLASSVSRDAWATQRRRSDFGRTNAFPF